MQIQFGLIARALEAATEGKLELDAYNVVLDYIQQIPNQTFLEHINKLYYVDCAITKETYNQLHNIV